MEYEGVNMNNDSIEYYEKNADEFVFSTINADVSSLYKEFEGHIKRGCRILDLGCGSGSAGTPSVYQNRKSGS